MAIYKYLSVIRLVLIQELELVMFSDSNFLSLENKITIFNYLMWFWNKSNNVVIKKMILYDNKK